MLASTVGPVALSVVVMLGAFLRGGSGGNKTKIIQQHIGYVITIAFLTLPAACTAIFRTFHCRPFDGINEQYLVVDYSVECGTPRHNAHRGIALFFVFIYVRLDFCCFPHLSVRDEAQSLVCSVYLIFLVCVFLWALCSPWAFRFCTSLCSRITEQRFVRPKKDSPRKR